MRLNTTKFITLLLSIFLFQNCSKLLDDTPKCSDLEVKKLAIEILKNEIYKEIKDAHINEQINTKDLIEYAYSNNLNYSDVLKDEKKKLDNEAEMYTKKVFSSITLENIRTTKIDKEVKKCDCEAEIKSGGYLKDIDATYTAQYNDEKNLYVELLYNIKDEE